MPARLKALPFDEKNERDFEEMTDRIRGALDSIRKNKSWKATQNTLAGLAQCSRKTLSLRRWPIDELRKIKHERTLKGSQTRKEAICKTDGAADREKQLIVQIRNYQRQNGDLFEQLQALEQEQTTAAIIRRNLEDRLSALSGRCDRLETDLRNNPKRNTSLSLALPGNQNR